MPLDRRTYELTAWRVNGPVEPIPLLLYHRLNLAGPKPAVVYYHGVTQSKDAYVDTHPLARRLADAGFVVAIPDAPGHGERPSGATLIARLRESLAHEFCLDIEQAADESPSLLDWLARQPEVDGARLGVIGVSMGGFTAAVVAARARDRLGAAVCVAGSADLPRCFAETDSIAPGKWGPADRSLDAETRARIARIDPLGYPERYASLHLLVLHGGRDTWNPCATSEGFAVAVQPRVAASSGAFRLTIVPGAPHWPPHPTMTGEAVEWLRHYVASTV
ncbi:MAG: alpha/beta hydrolase family protein [Chloroflexota bacterium]